MTWKPNVWRYAQPPAKLGVWRNDAFKSNSIPHSLALSPTDFRCVIRSKRGEQKSGWEFQRESDMILFPVYMYSIYIYTYVHENQLELQKTSTARPPFFHKGKTFYELWSFIHCYPEGQREKFLYPVFAEGCLALGSCGWRSCVAAFVSWVFRTDVASKQPT